MRTKVTGSVTRTFTWDADNRLTNITDNTTTIATFAYDYTGARVKKMANGNTTVYIGKLYECTNGNCSKYIFARDRRIALRPVGSSTVDYYHTDHLGSTNVLVDPVTGNVTLAYYPYGAVRVNLLGATNLGQGGIAHKFTGQELDEEAGLYYYGARYYDPALMRFISADPLGVHQTDPQTLNRYSYALNNPLRYIDPTGNQDEDPCGIGCTIGQWYSSLTSWVTSWFESQTTTSQEVYGPPSPSFDEQMRTIAEDMKVRIFQSGWGEKIPLLSHIGEQAVDLALAGDIRLISLADVSVNDKNAIAYYDETSGRIYIVKENYDTARLNIGQFESILSHEIGHGILLQSQLGPTISGETILGEQGAFNIETLYESLVLNDPASSYLGSVFGVPLSYPNTWAIQSVYPLGTLPGGVMVGGQFRDWTPVPP
jgi:RHS repeat-associated protein